MGELNPSQKSTSKIQFPGSEHQEKIDAWEHEPTLSHAVDVLGSGLFSSDHKVPESAIINLVDLQQSNPAVTNLLKAYIDASPNFTYGRLLVEKAHSSDDSRSRVGDYRAATRRFPHNAFLWVELARAHISVGAADKAIREMRIALALAPLDRFTTRAAVRLFSHIGEPDRAQYLLQKHKLLKQDPWLIASELAVSQLTGKSSRLINLAKSVSKQRRFAPFHLSELEGALGSIELASGANKKSKKHFFSSLLDPTENTVAQAVWGRSIGHHFDFDEGLLDIPNAFEAKTLEYVENARWVDAIEQCDLWQKDETFSSRPAEIGSYISAVALDDQIGGERFSRMGLLANPRSVTLKNNLAVCLCQQNKVKDAVKVFESINFHSLTDRDKESLVATAGLINFRLGQAEQGRNDYERAAARFRMRGDNRGVALALLHLANEEHLSGSGFAKRALKEAEKIVRIADQPEIYAMQKRLNARLTM